MPRRDPPIEADAIGRLLIGPLLALLLVLAANAARAAEPATEPEWPALTGQVVDAAGVLSPEARRSIADRLKAHEDATRNQIVVATVPGLQGLTIEDYANRLFRAWGIGQKTIDNGALLLVAPNDRKVRIEVGYGLEGTLTDALTKVVITTAMAPRFKQGDFAGGIGAGVDAILSLLADDPAADQWRQRETRQRADDVPPATVLFWIVVILAVVFLLWRMGGRGGGGRGPGGLVILPGPSGGWGGGFSEGGGFSGGFSGGGGSSGGGGASGDW